MTMYLHCHRKCRDFVDNHKFGHKWTAKGLALYHARTMLEDETTDEKFVVLISDGDTDKCMWNDVLIESCPWEKINLMAAHPQMEEAEELRRRSIRLIYVIAWEAHYDAHPEYHDRVNKMVSKPEDLIRAQHFSEKSTTGLRGGNYGKFVFIAIGTLTFLYTFMKALYLSEVLAGDLVGLICSYLQFLTATVTILLKVYTALISKNRFRFPCIGVMIAHILLDLAITAFAVHKGTESLMTSTFGTVGSFMDLTAYSLYLRLKAEKLE